MIISLVDDVQLATRFKSSVTADKLSGFLNAMADGRQYASNGVHVQRFDGRYIRVKSEGVLL